MWIEDGLRRPFLFVKKDTLFSEVKIIKYKNPINTEIRAKEVRLISNDGEQLGVVSLDEAMRISLEENLDLVMIAPKAKPPVCKIMDYHKFAYEQAKKEKEARKKQKTITVKEVRFSPTTEDHDVTIKANQARGFLNNGDKVKVTVRFRGRERAYTENGLEILKSFAQKLEDVSEMERKPKLEGRNMIMVLGPKKV